MNLHLLPLPLCASLWCAPVDSSLAAALAYAPAPPDNPLKGFVPYLRADSTFPHSLEWDYTKLSEVMTGPTNFHWAPFDAKFNAAASRKLKDPKWRGPDGASSCLKSKPRPMPR